MGALPIVGAGLGVVGTIAGISQQRSQAAQQNAAIAASQAGSLEQEALRMDDVRLQKQLQYEQWLNQNQQRVEQYRSDRQTLRQLALQNRMDYTQAQNTVRSGINNATSATEAGIANANTQVSQARNAGADAVYGARSRQGQVRRQSAQNVSQAGANVQSMMADRAGILARQNSRTRSAQSASQSMGRGAVEELLLAIQDATANDQIAQQEVLNSQFFRQSLEYAALVDRNSLQSQANAQLAGTRRAGQGALREYREDYFTNAQGINDTLNSLPADYQSMQSQANINLETILKALDSRSAAMTAQGAAQRASLESQRAQQPGLISSIAQIGQSAVPLAGAIMQANAMSNQPQPTSTLAGAGMGASNAFGLGPSSPTNAPPNNSALLFRDLRPGGGNGFSA